MVSESKGETAYELAIGTTALLANIPSPELAEGYGFLFLRYSQMGELLFNIIGYKTRDVPENIKAGQLKPATSALLNASPDWGIAGELAHSLEEYHPSEFYRIRPALKGGGGNQSPNFRKILKTSKDIWDSYIGQLQGSNLTLQAVHNNIKVKESNEDLYRLTQSLLDFDSAYQHFERRHLILIKRIVGQSGLTPLGNDLAKLEARLTAPLFPELWSTISPSE